MESETPENAVEIVEDGLPIVCFETEKGDIRLELYEDDAPNTVASFISLIEGKFYDGLAFHRVISNFMIQGGCPEGTGTGGPGYRFADEISDRKHDDAGILSMANAGPNTNGSQFFITHGPTPHLDGKHTVFGKVTEGMDVVNSIVQGDLIKQVIVQQKRSHSYEVNKL
ncbi:MAG: peptidylprolyl isomerase [SAR324 cluster bacterium]|nr:peptidylprolyl isomerase [SAR324 cluster bacterium]